MLDSVVLQGIILAQMFDPYLPPHVHEAMCGVDARLAMMDLVRLLGRAEELARRTRGQFYLRNPRQYPELRAVLEARSDYVL
jgi:hypothetical protein